MLDFMKPGIGGYATASADLDKTAWYSPRILGQKHYEFSDHLGNVQSVTLDRLTPVKATPTTIGTWRADLAGVWDYYPFGMYMPGRNVTDNSAQCVTISQPGLVAIRSRWWTQWYEPAVMAEQGPLIGLWRVAGGWQAPGSYLETFEGQPLLHAVVSQRGMGMERAVDVTPGSEYEVEATIDNREAGAELLYEVVHYFDEQGIEEPEVLASIPVARSGRYLLSFSSGDYQQVHVRVVARDVRGQARIKLGPISWWNITYVPGGEVLATVCNGKDAYRFGFNTQEKTNEIAGPGNHTTALFWEYDSRLGRRWNIDPKGRVGISHYATLSNDPINRTDVKGDQDGHEIRTRRMEMAYLEGKITDKQLMDFYRSNAYGAAIGLGIIATIYTGGRALPLLQRVAAWAIIHQQQAVAVGGLVASLLDPDPGSTVDYPGGLDDLARGTRLLFKNSKGSSRFIMNVSKLSFSLDDTVEYEMEGISLKVYCSQPNGRTAIHVRVDNGDPAPDTVKAEFFIFAWPSEINRLGQMLMSLDVEEYDAEVVWAAED